MYFLVYPLFLEKKSVSQYFRLLLAVVKNGSKHIYVLQKCLLKYLLFCLLKPACLLFFSQYKLLASPLQPMHSSSSFIIIYHLSANCINIFFPFASIHHFQFTKNPSWTIWACLYSDLGATKIQIIISGSTFARKSWHEEDFLRCLCSSHYPCQSHTA